MRFLRVVDLVGLCVIAGGCTLYGFGDNQFGQLGDGTTKTRLDPVAAARNPDWVMVDAGFDFSCGIDVHEALYCWGNNTHGELGLGTTGTGSGKSVPTRVGTANNWTRISAGGDSSGQEFACGIAAGSLYCWGWNHDGELGVGDTTTRSTPTQVGTDTDWKQVTAGGALACGIRTSGTLFCWGNGLIGDGTAEVHLNPVQIGTSTDWKLVAGGASHTCGIRTNGTLFCWGSNFDGAIGDGTFGPGNDRFTPTQVGTSTGWTNVGPGENHTCAIHGGAMFCWGDNTSGQLGNGSTSNPDDPDPGVPDPTQVGTATDWTYVAGGPGQACGIRAGGLLFCWGNAPSGDGTNNTYNVPVQAQFDKWSTISIGVLHKIGLRNVG